MIPKSILVYTDGEVIGDGIIKIPFSAALKKAFPGSRLTWLCSSDTVYTGALKEISQPFIDEIALVPPQKLSWKDVFGKHPFSGRRFDIVIDTQAKFKRMLWLRRISHGKFVSCKAEGTIFDGLMALASRAAGRKLSPEKIELPPQWKEMAEKLLPDGKRYIGFVPGAGQDFKQWPLDRFISLAQKQEKEGFTPVMFLGPREKEMADTIRAALPSAVFPLSGQTSPCLTIALGARLSVTIANDSGGGHLIAAGGSPMLSLFRSSSVRKKFMPSAPRVTAFAPEDFGGSKMDDIPLEAVEEALEKLLAPCHPERSEGSPC